MNTIMDEKTPLNPLPEHPTVSSEKGAFLAPIAIALSLLAAALAGYGFEQLRTMKLQLAELSHSATAQNTSAAQQDVSDVQTEVKTLGTSLDDARKEIDGLKATIADISLATHAPSENQANAESTALQSDAIAKKLDKQRKALKALKTSLSARVSALESQKEKPDATEAKATLRLSYQLLRSDILEGRPYRDSLSQVKALLVSNQADNNKKNHGLSKRDLALFSTLELSQDDGILTKAALYSALESIPVSGISSSPLKDDAALDESEAKSGFWHRTFSQFSSLVRIERIDETNSPIDRLNEAQRLMVLGDTRRTLQMLRELPSADQENFAVWMEDAHARLRVIDALNRLGASIFSSTLSNPSPEQ